MLSEAPFRICNAPIGISMVTLRTRARGTTERNSCVTSRFADADSADIATIAVTARVLKPIPDLMFGLNGWGAKRFATDGTWRPAYFVH